MKRVVLVLMVLMGMIVFGVTANAATLPAGTYEIIDGDTYVGPFPTSALPTATKTFLQEWNTSSRSYLSYFVQSNGIPTYSFSIFNAGSYSLAVEGGFLRISAHSGYRYVTMTYNPATGAWFPSKIYVADKSMKPGISGVVKSTLFTASQKSQYASYFYQSAGNVYITDDGGLFDQPPHKLTIQYQYEDGTIAAEPYEGTYRAGVAYSVTSPVIAGYAASQAVVSGTMPGEPVTVTVTYEPIRYTLRVKYQYENGDSAASEHVEQLTAGTSYHVESPTIAGYVPNKVSVSGTMAGGNITETVTYTPIRYTLTIQYQYADGRAAASDHVESLVEGTSYKVTSPPISGYTPDQSEVTGTMPGHDLTVTVTYREDAPELYQLCVQFLRGDGVAVASEYTEQLEAGAMYHVESPPITGYTPDRNVVSGIMPASDVIETVTYAKDAEPPPIDPPDPPDPPEPPPTPPSGGSMDGKVLEYSMFAPMFEYLRDNGGVVVTTYIKILLLMMGVCGAFAVVRKVIISAVSGRDEPPEIR